MKITYRKVNKHAGYNDTWLAPYVGETVKLVEYKDGNMKLKLGGHWYNNIQGPFIASNGWQFTTKKILGKPLKKKGIK